MGLKTTFKRFFDLDDDLPDEQVEPSLPKEQKEQPLAPKEKPKQNVVSLKSVQKETKVVLIEPKRFTEVQVMADHLINHRPIVINLQRMPLNEAKRVLDFLSGIVYAINGEMQKLGTQTFLCVPNNIDITGVISEVMDEEAY